MVSACENWIWNEETKIWKRNDNFLAWLTSSLFTCIVIDFEEIFMDRLTSFSRINQSINQSIRIECSIINLTWLRLWLDFDFSRLSCRRIGSSSNDDGDGNENVQCITLICEFNSLPSLHNYDVKLPVQSFRVQIQENCQQLTNWTIWNIKLDQVWSSVNSLVKWRFRSHGCRS